MPVLILLGATFGATFAGGLVAGATLAASFASAAFTTGLTALSILSRQRSSTRTDPSREIRSTVEPARYILGRARTTGILAFYNESDRDSNYGPMQVDIILVVSEGECESIDAVFVDGRKFQITNRIATVDGGEQLVGNAFWDARMKIWSYLDASGNGGRSLRIAFPDLWTVNHRLDGLSYIHVRMIQNDYTSQDNRFFKQYPNIEFLVKGIKVSYPGQLAPVWTENAAALRYWYMTKILGVLPERIDNDHFQYAYCLCEEEVSVSLPVTHAIYEGTDKRYSINGVITTDDDPSSTLNEMDFAWQGSVVEADARLYFRPGADRVPQYTIDDSVIIRPGSVSVGPAIQDRINAISMSLQQSSFSDYKPQDLLSLRDSTIIQNRDQCNVLWQDIGARRFVVNPISAGRLMYISLYRARGLRSCIYTVSPGSNLQFLYIIPGDIVNLIDSHLDLNIIMIVTRVTTNDDWSITVELLEVIKNTYIPRLHLPPAPDAVYTQTGEGDPSLPYVPDLPSLPL